MGQLTAGLAHELRNPLGTIKASADMLEQNLPKEDEIARELSGYISSEVDRTNSLVSRFLDFARPLELRRSANADLGDVLVFSREGPLAGKPKSAASPWSCISRSRTDSLLHLTRN